MNKDKNTLWNEYVKLLDGETVSLGELFDYFSSDDLQGFLEHLEEERDY